jgi:SH3-like domain-containing protein
VIRTIFLGSLVGLAPAHALATEGAGAPPPKARIAADAGPHAAADAGPNATAGAGPAERVPATPPFLGVVLGDDVNVRAGPGKNYEVVAQLAGGDRVGVLGEAFGWFLVRPAREIRAYVHKDLVETKGPGVGVVLRDRTNLRSRPAADSTVIGQCARGDLVRLLDAQGDWLALAAPPGASFYVHRDLVRAVAPWTEGALETAPAGKTLQASAPAAAPPTPLEKVRRACDLYLAELGKDDLDRMDFAAARALFEEAEREANDPQTRADARAGLERIKIAERLQEDYRKRVKPIRTVLGQDDR